MSQTDTMKVKQSPSPPQGFATPDFEHVKDVFQTGFSNGTDRGSTLSVYYKGSLVVSLWGGRADYSMKRPWREDIFGYFHSGAKFLSAIVIAHLVERGLLEYEEKVSKYWPEFAQNGKESITLSMLLSHRAGLSLMNEDYCLGWMRDKPNHLTEMLQNCRPLYAPGTKVAYSSILVGLYLSEIVRRVDPKQRNLSQYFHEEIDVPFGLDVHIGLPKALHHRTSRLEWPRMSPDQQLNKIMSNFQGNINLYRRNMYEPVDWNSRWKLNDPEFAELPCPSSHLIGTSKSVAKLAGILSIGGEHNGKQLLKQSMIKQLQKPKSHGMDYISGANSLYGQGTMLIPVRQGDKTWFLFGHSGLGGQQILTDSHNEFGFAYCTNFMNPLSSFHNNNWKCLLEAVYKCVQMIAGNKDEVRLFASYDEYLEDLKIHPVVSRL